MCAGNSRYLDLRQACIVNDQGKTGWHVGVQCSQSICEVRLIEISQISSQVGVSPI